MRLRLGAFAGYRPRVLTLVVFVAIAALIFLANFVGGAANSEKVAYGWPLIWHWHTILVAPSVVGVGRWEYDRVTLCTNATLWLLILAAGGGACEWRLRRHPLRFRWSLKTMLVAVGIAAAICGWCAAARSRARIQDEIISLARNDDGTAYFERWGPRWLDLVGADRYRRSVIGLKFNFYDDQSKQDFARITQLLDLRQLQILRISFHWGDESGELGAVNSVLTIVGDLTQLEELGLEGPMIMSDRLDCLARLTNLKFLTLSICDLEEDETGDGGRSSLSHLPMLPQLEALKLGGESLGGADLCHLAILPRLKSLAFDGADYLTDESLAELAPLDLLEELEISQSMASPTGFQSLCSLKRLKTLHIDSPRHYIGQRGKVALDHDGVLPVFEEDIASFSRALHALRQSCPGIIVDTNGEVLYTRHSHWDELPDRGVPEYLRKQMTFPFLPQWLSFQQ